MKIDIAICTFNRARLLRDTLKSIVAAEIPADHNVRVIVVNNNSTDETDDVVNAAAGSFNIHLAHEQQQGHTHARNKAIEIADGDLLLWTDDDVIVDRRWITTYANAAKNPDQSFWGGHIRPLFRPEAPAWISENMSTLGGCFAVRDLGDSAIEFSPERLPYGANFAIRTGLQKAFPFDCGLGREGGQVTGEDELDLLRRVIEDGHKGNWVPENRVTHVISAERQTEDYIFRYFKGQGRALRKKGKLWTQSRTRLRFQALYEQLAYKFKRQRSASPAWVAHLIRHGLAEGQIEGLSEAKN